MDILVEVISGRASHPVGLGESMVCILKKHTRTFFLNL